MDTQRFLDLLRSDGELLAAAAGDLDAEVPPCPGWRVRDAVEHTAAVYEHKLICIADRANPDPWPPPDWPAGRDPVAWFTDAHGRLLDVLTSTDPATPAYTWFPPDQTVGFWVRRMAQETAVHRVDVQSAAGAVTPVDAELAADGVDEVLTLMLAGDWSDEPFEAVGEGDRIAVVTGGRSWLVTLEPKEVSVEETAGAADATISGASSDVLLWLWGRVPDAAVEISGDHAAAQRFRERLAYATE